MTVFRWILGVLAGFFAIGAVFGFALFIAFESQIWLERARHWRHYEPSRASYASFLMMG